MCQRKAANIIHYHKHYRDTIGGKAFITTLVHVCSCGCYRREVGNSRYARSHKVLAVSDPSQRLGGPPPADCGNNELRKKCEYRLWSSGHLIEEDLLVEDVALVPPLGSELAGRLE